MGVVQAFFAEHVPAYQQAVAAAKATTEQALLDKLTPPCPAPKPTLWGIWVETAMGRIDAAQGRYVAELTALHERTARAEHDRDRLMHELEAHLRTPWWRKLFA